MENNKTKIIHCESVVDCEIGLNNCLEEKVDEDFFREVFLNGFDLGYILDIAKDYNIHFHIVRHLKETSTCQEKASITGLPLERVIKGIYLQDSKNGKTYALAIPGDKKYDKYKIGGLLGIPENEINERLVKAREEDLPMGIKFGTVHPFNNMASFIPRGKLEFVFFDIDYLVKVSSKDGYDDFSFTVPKISGYPNHLISLQTRYDHAFIILNEKFGSEKIKTKELT